MNWWDAWRELIAEALAEEWLRQQQGQASGKGMPQAKPITQGPDSTTSPMKTHQSTNHDRA